MADLWREQDGPKPILPRLHSDNWQSRKRGCSSGSIVPRAQPLFPLVRGRWPGHPGCMNVQVRTFHDRLDDHPAPGRDGGRLRQGAALAPRPVAQGPDEDGRPCQGPRARLRRPRHDRQAVGTLLARPRGQGPEWIGRGHAWAQWRKVAIGRRPVLTGRTGPGVRPVRPVVSAGGANPSSARRGGAQRPVRWGRRDAPRADPGHGLEPRPDRRSETPAVLGAQGSAQILEQPRLRDSLISFVRGASFPAAFSCHPRVG